MLPLTLLMLTPTIPITMVRCPTCPRCRLKRTRRTFPSESLYSFCKCWTCTEVRRVQLSMLLQCGLPNGMAGLQYALQEAITA